MNELLNFTPVRSFCLQDGGFSFFLKSSESILSIQLSSPHSFGAHYSLWCSFRGKQFHISSMSYVNVMRHVNLLHVDKQMHLFALQIL